MSELVKKIDSSKFVSVAEVSQCCPVNCSKLTQSSVYNFVNYKLLISQLKQVSPSLYFCSVFDGLHIIMCFSAELFANLNIISCHFLKIIITDSQN